MIEDWDINVAVQEILVSNYVDLKEVDFNSIGGIVSIKGNINFAPPRWSKPPHPLARMKQQEIEEARMLNIERKIKKIEGVKSVKFQLLNWEKVNARWRKRREKE
jgi:hypothetical protein